MALMSRRRGQQGRKFKAPEVRDLLWQWFVDIRHSIANILSPKAVLNKAKALATALLHAAREHGIHVSLPDLNKSWLLSFKRAKGIVFRKPNTRFKCSKAALTRRLRALWMNSIRIRALARHFLHDDLTTRFLGVDEKPLHFNEAGSKNRATLEISGVTNVRLRREGEGKRGKFQAPKDIETPGHTRIHRDIVSYKEERCVAATDMSAAPPCPQTPPRHTHTEVEAEPRGHPRAVVSHDIRHIGSEGGHESAVAH